MDFPFNKPEEKTGYLIYQIYLLWQRKVSQVIEDLDLTYTQFLILLSTAWLSNTGNSVSQSDISNFLKIDRMMTSRLTKKLVEKEMIEFDENSKGRSKCIKLLPLGYEHVQRVIPRMESAEDDFYGVIGDEHEKLNEYLQLIFSHNQKSDKRFQNESDK